MQVLPLNMAHFCLVLLLVYSCSLSRQDGLPASSHVVFFLGTLAWGACCYKIGKPAQAPSEARLERALASPLTLLP